MELKLQTSRMLLLSVALVLVTLGLCKYRKTREGFNQAITQQSIEAIKKIAITAIEAGKETVYAEDSGNFENIFNGLKNNTTEELPFDYKQEENNKYNNLSTELPPLDSNNLPKTNSTIPNEFEDIAFLESGDRTNYGAPPGGDMSGQNMPPPPPPLEQGMPEQNMPPPPLEQGMPEQYMPPPPLEQGMPEQYIPPPPPPPGGIQVTGGLPEEFTNISVIKNTLLSDRVLKAALFASLFFLLNHKDMQPLLKKMVKNVPKSVNTLLHPAVVFGVLYYVLELFI